RNVTGVQTCALPIYPPTAPTTATNEPELSTGVESRPTRRAVPEGRSTTSSSSLVPSPATRTRRVGPAAAVSAGLSVTRTSTGPRPEERRGGEEGGGW